MSWLMAAIYDRFMAESERKRFGPWRDELLALLDGEGLDVLEVGGGTGVNLTRYPASLSRLTVTEPDRAMRRKLERRLGALGLRFPVEVSDAAMEQLPFADRRFDAVVVTLVLCSVRETTRALGEIRRVLKPGGRLVFLEHVASEDSAHLRWQRRFEPLWRRMSGNCHLTRDTESALRDAGFTFERIDRWVERRRFLLVKETVRGVATVGTD